MTPRLSRRQALTSFGTVSLGALPGESATTTPTPVPTSEGGTATVEPQTAPKGLSK